MKSKLFVLVGLVVLSLVLAACGGGSAASGFTPGKYLKQNSMNSGLEFKEDGTFAVFSGDTILVTGTYKVEGNVFTETSNTGGCDTNVAFNYTFDGSKLTFTYAGTPQDDADCSGRYADFNNVTYTLMK
ncbi:MAG: hypothetical protein QY328_01925 [Anaerolineales bacterium]|nr:MAG: hypothetical protein QY328_01925 [Anaerolineales bacterium]